MWLLACNGENGRKGKNIDELLSHGAYSGVARFQGGANAGHTIKFQDKTFIVISCHVAVFKKILIYILEMELLLTLYR